MTENFPLNGESPDEGVRERKRRDTRRRIAEVGQSLFLVHGFEGTTVDAIAEAAGISRRSFFSYFKAKDDIIVFWQQADSALLFAELLNVSPVLNPLDAVRDVMVDHIARYPTEQMTVIDNLMQSSPTLLARKQAFYAEQEQALFNTLTQVWREPEQKTALRLVAMASIGAMRLSLLSWREQAHRREPVATFLRQAFDRLKAGL